jgi:hypothetical protein
MGYVFPDVRRDQEPMTTHVEPWQPTHPQKHAFGGEFAALSSSGRPLGDNVSAELPLDCETLIVA